MVSRPPTPTSSIIPETSGEWSDLPPTTLGQSEMEILKWNKEGLRKRRKRGIPRFNLNLLASSLSPITGNAKSKQIFSFKHGYNESIASHLGQRLQKQRRKFTFSDPVIPHACVNFSFLLFSSNLRKLSMPSGKGKGKGADHDSPFTCLKSTMFHLDLLMYR